ncbi:UNVERIFIED_CONTAM: hypothetical protein FKN15_005542, partial [Acipenser sinensis]
VFSQVERIENRYLELFGKDYKYSIIHNANGEVCGHYPQKIVFLEYESSDHDKDRFESTVQVTKLQDLVNRSKMARCRGRFVCPVILYNGKHICRSSTLAGWGELYGRTGYNYIFSGRLVGEYEWFPSTFCTVKRCKINGDSQLFDKVRGHDIKLLRYLSVRYICDLMVENKKVKFGLNVTSSEKVDKAQRYADFTLLSVPYPGCEFFKDYKDRDYTAEGLVFNWNQDFVDAPLTIPESLSKNLNINWREYQDGVIHATLEPAEILYLTIAYDWFLFGHMLPDRLSKGEEIFFFCFNFLKHITSEKFSAVKKQRSTGEYARSGSSVSTNYGSWQIVSGCGSINDRGSLTTESPLPFSFQDEGANGRMCPPVPERQARLEMVREVFLSAYSATVGLKSSASPSGAITGLLEQFARGVGLRGTNMIV